MTSPRDPLFDQRIADWLENDPDHAPVQALDIILAAVPSIPQRHASRVPWRFPTMTTHIRLATAAVIGVLALGGAFYFTRPDQPAIGGPSPEPSASEIASVPASPSASPSPAVIQPREPSWIATGPMIEGRVRLTATLLPDGKVLVAGGGGFGGDGVFALASAELYDPSARSWTATGNMATVRQGHTATLLPDGKVLVAGGTQHDDERLSSAELYDPSSGSWTATGNMAAGRTAQTATLLPDGKVLIAGGWDVDSLASAELYDPGSGSWTATGNMAGNQAAQSDAASQTATLLPDGKVLVVGSTTDSGFAAELYDPGSGSWTLTGPMAAQRFLHTATLLPNGNVLVAGGGGLLAGGGGHSGPVDLAELYDPSTRSWAAAGNMITGGGSHTATLLRDGRVLVASSSDRTELYDPGSGN